MSELRNVISADDAAAALWDVVVVGAGPAGSVLARQSARGGARTLLIDRDMPPRNKVCGGCLGAAGAALLDEIGLGDCLNCGGRASFDRILIAAGRRRVALPVACGHVVLRQEFDRALVEAAVGAGGAFLPEVSAVGSRISDDGLRREVSVRSGQGTHVVNAQCVIAADGLGGRFTADALGSDDRAVRRSRFGVGTLVRWERDYESGIVHMALGSGGYVGVVRVSPTLLIVAGAFTAPHVRAAGGPGGLAARLLEQAELAPIDALVGAQWKGTPEMTRSRARVAAHRLLAIGDTNGYVEPITGEGMTWAIASGIAAAPFALTSLAGWDDRIERGWTRRHGRVIRSRHRSARFLHHALNHQRASQLAIALLAKMPQMSGPFVSRLSRPYSLPV